jgi:hypothetical protein
VTVGNKITNTAGSQICQLAAGRTTWLDGRQADEQSPSDGRAKTTVGPEAHACRTSAGGVDARLTAIRGTYDSLSVAADASLLSVSARGSDRQVEVAAHLSRLATGGKIGRGTLKASAETFSARAAVGTENPDGSRGVNAGLSASALSGELTAESSGNSFTIGGSFGPAAAGSVGVRDADHDGQSELCVRVEAGPVILGACVENPF